MKILVCDRCGYEMTEKDDITLAVEGSESWQTATRTRGNEPRGVYPCKNYIRCNGEMVFQEKKKKRLFQK